MGLSNEAKAGAVMLGVVALPFALFFGGCGQGIPYSDGFRVGVVTKFSHKGLICKTWEGSMNLGAMSADRDGAMSADRDGVMVPTVWEFTVTDPAVVAQVEAAQSSGRSARLTYTQGLFYGPCTSHSGYFVSAVQ